MNAKPISAPVSQSLALLVQYTRERRSANENAIAATDPGQKRLHTNSYRQLSEAMNYTTIKALRAGYDMDMLAWLVQAATDRDLETLACLEGGPVELATAIQAMRDHDAAQVPASKPKAKARKVDDFDAYAVAAQLRNATSREQAQAAIAGLTIERIRRVAKAYSLAIPSKLRKAEQADYLLHFTIDIKLAHAAIMNAK